MRENIAYGRLDATEAEIMDAARRARLGGDDRATARRTGHGDRRARRQALGRAEAAPRHRADVPEEPADPDPGRGDLGARHRDRAGDPAIAGPNWPRAARRWSSPTGWRRSRTPTGSWWSTKPASPSRGGTTNCSRRAIPTRGCTTRSMAGGWGRPRSLMKCYSAKIARPTRTMVAPSSMATGKSLVMPIERSGRCRVGWRAGEVVA